MKNIFLMFPIFSGILFALALPGYGLTAGAFFAPALLVYSLKKRSLNTSILLCAAAGLSEALIYYTWAVQSSMRYAQSVSLSGIGVYLGMSLFHSLWFALLGAGLFFVLRNERISPAVRGILTAAVWVSMEWLVQNILPSYPWIIQTAYTQSDNLYLLQWLSIGGMWLISFFVIAASVLSLWYLEEKKFRSAGMIVILFISLHLAGYVMLLQATNQKGDEIRTVILQENIDAEDRWNSSYADTIARTFLKLNAEAAELDPDLIVWSETAIPWTFRPDDDLVTEVLRTTARSRASHIIGMLTDGGGNGTVYNSLYYIESDGRVTGRYDKRVLLSFLETPFFSFELPFSQSTYSNILHGKRPNIFPTASGMIGTLICNETLSPYPSLEAKNKGASFFFAASNDGWFSGSTLVDAHWALTRMRAIEMRRDIVVNANLGFAGLIRASGESREYPPSNVPRCITVSPARNSAATVYARFPDAAAYVLMVIGIIYFVYSATAGASKQTRRK